MSRSSPVEVYEPDTLNNINPENISQAEYVGIFLALLFPITEVEKVVRKLDVTPV